MKSFSLSNIILCSGIIALVNCSNNENQLSEELQKTCEPVPMGLCPKCSSGIYPVCSYNEGHFQWHRNDCILLSLGCNPGGIAAGHWFKCNNSTKQCHEIPVEYN